MADRNAEGARLTEDEQDVLIRELMSDDDSCVHNVQGMFDQIERIIDARLAEVTVTGQQRQDAEFMGVLRAALTSPAAPSVASKPECPDCQWINVDESPLCEPHSRTVRHLAAPCQEHT